MKTFIFKMLDDIRHKGGVLYHGAGLEVEMDDAFFRIPLAVARQVDRRRVGKREKFINAPLTGGVEKPLLARLFCPVIAAVSVLEALSAPPGIADVGVLTLLRCAGGNIETPERQADAFGIALVVKFLTEQQIGDALAFCKRPVCADKLTAPRIRSAKAVNGLIAHGWIDREFQGFGFFSKS